MFRETLTGFKWLGNVAKDLEAEGLEVLFAFEEAIGFMFGAVHKDKDGVAAAAVFTEMAAQIAAQHDGRTVAQHLDWLYGRTVLFFTPHSRAPRFVCFFIVHHQPVRNNGLFTFLRR